MFKLPAAVAERYSVKQSKAILRKGRDELLEDNLTSQQNEPLRLV